jgi:hypothetical protein
MVGFAPRDIATDGKADNFNRTGYYLFLAEGTLRSGGAGHPVVHPNAQRTETFAGQECHKGGTVIRCTWDREARTIGFAINGRDCGLTHFKNVPTSGLYPALDIANNKSSLHLLQL